MNSKYKILASSRYRYLHLELLYTLRYRSLYLDPELHFEPPHGLRLRPHLSLSDLLPLSLADLQGDLTQGDKKLFIILYYSIYLYIFTDYSSVS